MMCCYLNVQFHGQLIIEKDKTLHCDIAVVQFDVEESRPRGRTTSRFLDSDHAVQRHDSRSLTWFYYRQFQNTIHSHH